MNYKKKVFEEQDYIRVRDFLKRSLKETPYQRNWMIDRWNFARYWGQIMHRTFDTWPETVGLWEDEKGEIAAVVTTEGDFIGRDTAEVYFLLGRGGFSEKFINELIDHAEKKLAIENEEGKSLRIRVNAEQELFKEVLRKRSYILQDWKEPMASIGLEGDFKVELPEGFRIEDARKVSDYEKGFAHGKAFGYYNQDVPDDDDAECCYKFLRNAPDYRPELDIAVLDKDNHIAAFATIWYDELNKVGILEPVGTVPKYRKIGLGKAVIYEVINRAKEIGANKVFVGSEQQFYFSIGFQIEYYKEVWGKTFK